MSVSQYLFLDRYTTPYLHPIKINESGVAKKFSPRGIKVLESNDIYLHNGYDEMSIYVSCNTF